MNKKLVALAVAGVLAAPLAQAQTANVTLYGRESFIGLQGGWGTVKIGRFLAPYDDIHPIFGNVPTLTTSILSTAELWAQGFQGKNAGGFDDRIANSIRYDSANLSGFTVSIQYGAQGNQYAQPGAPIPAPTAAQTPHAGVVGANVLYNNGPISLGVGYEGNFGVRGKQTAAAGGGNLNDTAISVAGAYSFSIVRIGAVYEMLKYDYVSGGDLKRNFFGVSLTANLGPGQAYLFYGQANNGTGSAASNARVAGLVMGDDSRAVQYEISYTYPLSKRTLLYAGYNKIANDHRAQYNFNINAYNPISTTGATDSAYATPGGKPAGIVLGAVHFF